MFKKQLFSRFFNPLPHPYELFLPQNAQSPILIVITPLLGRILFLQDMFIERSFARYFAQRGFAVALIHRPIFEFDHGQPIEQLNTYLHDSVARNRRVLDELMRREDLMDYRIASLGLSFGSVVNCIWAGQDERLRYNIFGLLGGNIPEVFLKSADPLMREHQAAAKKAADKHGINLEDKLSKIFDMEPLNFAPQIKTPHNLLILALFDWVVPFKNGQLVKKAFHHSKALYLPLGHLTSIITVPWMKRVASSFIANAFKGDS